MTTEKTIEDLTKPEVAVTDENSKETVAEGETVNEVTPRAVTKQYLDEAGLRRFAGKTKEYADSRTVNRVTNVVVGTDVIDITIDTTSGSEPSLINFEIAGTSYQAEEGMTWEQWVSSSYNTVGCVVNNGLIYNASQNQAIATGKPTAPVYVKATDVIEADYPYSFYSYGGGI